MSNFWQKIMPEEDAITDKNWRQSDYCTAEKNVTSYWNILQRCKYNTTNHIEFKLCSHEKIFNLHYIIHLNSESSNQFNQLEKNYFVINNFHRNHLEKLNVPLFYKKLLLWSFKKLHSMEKAHRSVITHSNVQYRANKHTRQDFSWK